MSMLRTVIRIVARERRSAHEILVSVNDYIMEDIPPGIFITIFLGVYNVAKGKMNFVSAGHNPLIFCSYGKKKTALINPQGPPLGVMYEPNSFAGKLREQEVSIKNGDLLFVYSDGITESMNRSGHKYGLDRLVEYFNGQIATNSLKPPAEISADILADIDRHAGAAEQNDDITFIVVTSASEKKSALDSETVES